MDKENLICTGPALDMFCNLELYADDDTLEIDLLLFKHFVLKKRVISKEGLAFAWCGQRDSMGIYYGTGSYIGILMYNGDSHIIPMYQIRRGSDFLERYNEPTITLYRNIIEQVISAKAIGIDGLDDYGLDVSQRGRKRFEISDAKKYKKWLSQIYNETKQPDDTPEDVCVRMKANNIQGKLLDKLQNDGFLYSRKYTWDKVYKRENE